MAPAMLVVLPAARSVNVPVPTPWTASLNVAEMSLPTATPVAPASGLRADTVGAVVSVGAAAAVVNDQVAVAMALPAVSLMPVRAAVYVVPAARAALGVSVATRVVAL